MILKFKIEVYRKSDTDLLGEGNEEIQTRDAMIDMNCVESAWIDFDDVLVIKMKSGDSFRTRDFTFDQFESIFDRGKQLK
jgi:hypothetical protein